MNKNPKNKKILVLLSMLLAAVLIFTGCGGSQTGSGEDIENPITVTMTIDYPEEADATDLENVEVTVEEGTSLLKMLKRYGRENDVAIVVSSSGWTYVTGIGGVSEKDFGDTSGWVYYVNDEMPMTTADDYILADGDDILWQYVDTSAM